MRISGIPVIYFTFDRETTQSWNLSTLQPFALRPRWFMECDNMTRWSDHMTWWCEKISFTFSLAQRKCNSHIVFIVSIQLQHNLYYFAIKLFCLLTRFRKLSHDLVPRITDASALDQVYGVWGKHFFNETNDKKEETISKQEGMWNLRCLIRRTRMKKYSSTTAFDNILPGYCQFYQDGLNDLYCQAFHYLFVSPHGIWLEAEVPLPRQ